MEVELNPLDSPAHDDPATALAERELVDAALAGSIPAIARWSPCTTSWGCRCRGGGSLGIPLGTAKSRLHHAIAAMRPVIAEPDAVPAAVAGGQVA